MKAVSASQKPLTPTIAGEVDKARYIITTLA
jgi:hypothetical protein